MGDLFHLREIDVQTRSLCAKSLSNDNFSPLLGKSANGLQFFPCELPCRHEIVILDLRLIFNSSLLILQPQPTFFPCFCGVGRGRQKT